MELIYYYHSGSGRPDQGFNLSNKYFIDHDLVRNRIDVSRNSQYIPSLYGKNVLSVVGIIGENGSGKTTLLYNISKTLAYGNDIEQAGDFSFIAIYEHENDICCYFFNCKKEIIAGNGIITVDVNRFRAAVSKITTTYFSQHIEALYSNNIFNVISQDRFKGRMDISTSYIYRQIGLGQNKNKSFIDVTAKFAREENRRFLKLYKNVTLKFGINIPKYLVLKFRTEHVNIENTDHNLVINEFVSSMLADVQGTESLLKYSLLKGAILNASFILSTNKRFHPEEYFSELTRLTKERLWLNGSEVKFFSMLLKFMPDELLIRYQVVLKLLKYLSDLEQNNIEITGESVLYEIRKHNLRDLLTEFDKIGLFKHTLDFIELSYAYDALNNVTFSSGEYAILGLFSRIYDNKLKFRGNNILLLDEAEIGLHPQWQREFINVLMDFLNNNFGKKKFQVVLTSHSPVVLSDIPRWAVCFVDGMRRTNDWKNLPNTFGANIHELYSGSFALDGSLVGEFARIYIQSIAKELYEKNELSYNETKKYLKRIQIIDEPFVKEKLIARLAEISDKNGINRLIEYKKGEIRELEKLRYNK